MKKWIPEFNGRLMVKIKKYKRFTLYQDLKTGIRECFSEDDLVFIQKEKDREERKRKNRQTNSKTIRSDTRFQNIVNMKGEDVEKK